MVSQSSVVALLVAVLATCCTSATAYTDIDILQFALNLEYLEGNFYSCATYGKPLDKSLWGVGGVKPLGCKKALLSPDAYAYAAAVTKDEVAHVKFLRTAIKGANAVPVSQPAIDIGTAFSTAANAALGTTLPYNFTPYASDVMFYLGAFIFEDVGSSAYLGALPLIANKNITGAAAAIMGVESYHAASIRTLLKKYADKALYPYGAPVNAVINAISHIRDVVAGTTSPALDSGIMDSTGAQTLAPTNSYSLLNARNVTQVLQIVYLGGMGKGGFFPAGMNGLFK